MNRKRRLWIIIGIGIVFTVVIGIVAFQTTRVCCALPIPATQLTRSTGVESNEETVALLNQTQTAAASKKGDLLLLLTDTMTAAVLVGQTYTAVFETALASAITATPSSYPYDPTLYAQRRHEIEIFKTAGGPTEWAIFVATETALVMTYQGTIPATATPIPYTADMSPTALPRSTDTTRTATPTLCPPSDVICPGGNETLSPADKVMMLMGSASAPEFGQLAQTATALAITPTPTPTSANVRDSNCAFSWAHQDLPEIADAAREALSPISMARYEVLRADAYGESCGSAFSAMTTDFYLSVDMVDLSNTNHLAQIVKTAYTVLSELKVKLPAKVGYLDIVFKEGDGEKHFRAMFIQVKSAIDNGKSDAELLALGGMRQESGKEPPP